MSIRHVDVCQVAPVRTRHNGTLHLHIHHPKWRSVDGNHPALTFPAKKIAVGLTTLPPTAPRIEATLRAVLQDELGFLPSVPLPVCRPERPRATLISPTTHSQTVYTLFPVVVPVTEPEADNLAHRMGGVWLSTTEALAHPHLSPTAKLVLQGLENQTDAQGSLSDPQGWTARLAAARSGDARAFGQLFEEIKPRLRQRLLTGRTTRWVGLIPEDIEEVIAETAVKAWHSLERFDPRQGTAEMWLGTIAFRVAVSLLRKRGSRKSVPLDWLDTSASVGHNRSRAPQAILEAAEESEAMRQHLAQALAAADELTRQIWELRFGQGKEYGEIAAELGIPQGTVGTRVHRLKQALRREAEGLAGGRERVA